MTARSMMLRRALLAGIAIATALPAYAKDGWQSLSWFQARDVDKLSGDVSTYVAAQAAGGSGTSIQVTAKCLPGGVSFEFLLFRGGSPLTLPGSGSRELLRVRFDEAPVQQATASRDYTNGLGIVFIDKQRVQQMGDAPLHSPDAQQTVGQAEAHNNAAIFANILVSKLSQFALEQMAVGTLLNFAQAKSIGVEIPVPDEESVVIDLTPSDATLRAYVASCIR